MIDIVIFIEIEHVLPISFSWNGASLWDQRCCNYVFFPLFLPVLVTATEVTVSLDYQLGFPPVGAIDTWS